MRGGIAPVACDCTLDQWMFRHPDGRRWIGYRAGTYIADRAIAASGLSAAQLVLVPTDEILEMAGVDMRKSMSIVVKGNSWK